MIEHGNFLSWPLEFPSQTERELIAQFVSESIAHCNGHK